MKSYNIKKTLMVSAALLALTVNTAQANEFENVFKEGDFFGNARYRYENVDQTGFANDADASTLRLSLGYKTGMFYGFQALAEMDSVTYIGNDNFDNSINNKVTYPLVADPDGVDLNQSWLSYNGIPDTVIRGGREALNLDNQRFIGTVGWRQNDQTFDMASVTNKSLENTELFYGYMWNVNRIFGRNHGLGDLESDNHLLRVKYNYSDALNVTGYGYWMDFNDSTANSNRTYGLRLNGKMPINDASQFIYELEWATQDDYGNNTANYDADYYHIAPKVTYNNFTFGAGYEVLEGNGTNAFITPLATGHKYNGWADKFLATPANGLEDAYVSAAYKFANTHEWIDGTKLAITYHDFDADQTSVNYGDEIDIVAKRALPIKNDFIKSASVLVKYADYDADTFATDTKKFWLMFQAGF